MKSKMTILMVLATQFGLITNLMAESGVREDSSSFLVWAFLGMCALIVIVQLVPATVLVLGMLRSLFTDEKQSPVEISISSEE
jgi:hypothetical protein